MPLIWVGARYVDFANILDTCGNHIPGFDAADTISPHYDSMVAKLIDWGDNRAQALARLDAALAATHSVGLSTNVAFLRRVVNTTAFATADLDTALIERERAALFEYPPLPLECAAAGVVARELALESALQGKDPWSRRDGWRLFGGATRRFDLDVGGVRQTATLHRAHDGARDALRIIRRCPVRHDLVGADLTRRPDRSGQRLDVYDFGGTPIVHRLVAGKSAGCGHGQAANDEAGNQ